MRRVLGYAQDLGYTKYTSTLEEAWRLSIRGLTGSMIEAVRTSDCNLDIRCEEDVCADPASAFGILEARQHRTRGIPFEMFLALMEYYEQAFVDLCDTLEDRAEANSCAHVVMRFFGRTRIAFASEWAQLGTDEAVKELQVQNRSTTDEKVRYLTIFESLNVPVILLDEHGLVENINESAARVFGMESISGSSYYSHVAVGEPFEPLRQEIAAFLKSSDTEHELSRVIETASGPRFNIVRLKRMQDVSGKFRGITVALNDVTERKLIEDEALQSRAQYRALFENMVDAVAQHQAVRDETGRVRDYRFVEVNPAFVELFGLRPDDLIGRGISEVWPPGHPLGVD